MYLADDEKAKDLSKEIDHQQYHWPNVAVHSNFTKDWHWIDSINMNKAIHSARICSTVLTGLHYDRSTNSPNDQCQAYPDKYPVVMQKENCATYIIGMALQCVNLSKTDLDSVYLSNCLKVWWFEFLIDDWILISSSWALLLWWILASTFKAFVSWCFFTRNLHSHHVKNDEHNISRYLTDLPRSFGQKKSTQSKSRATEKMQWQSNPPPKCNLLGHKGSHHSNLKQQESSKRIILVDASNATEKLL